MKHELKNALVTLNVINNVPSSIYINGDINCLVQVINNMITNAIQSYNNAPNKTIDLILNVKDNNLVIQIKDYGPGILKKFKKSYLRK